MSKNLSVYVFFKVEFTLMGPGTNFRFPQYSQGPSVQYPVLFTTEFLVSESQSSLYLFLVFLSSYQGSFMQVATMRTYCSFVSQFSMIHKTLDLSTEGKLATVESSERSPLVRANKRIVGCTWFIWRTVELRYW